MAIILKGAEVAEQLNSSTIQRVEKLKEKGVSPCLAIVRVGDSPEDLAYAKSAQKRCQQNGVEVMSFALPVTAEQDELMKIIEKINTSRVIHGCLLLRPLPKHFDDEAIRNALSPEKDIDGITDVSLAGVFSGANRGYPPCTAAACIEILKHYGVELKGKRAVVVGRSLVIGKPVAMLLLGENATVTICHTKTQNLPEVCRNAQVLIAAAGRAGIIGRGFFAPDQVVIDVGINVDENGKLCGDADFEAALELVGAITPVPGGVGTVTTSVLVEHVVSAAEKSVGM
ncbi:MAG: bifunctional 5,10-methylenetetrahydrofolate dehydrogenase/5,10-methenyltetrahydrofolate cyclohydrolase [Oscillospiraceae bacterium]|jgi:methylenetetrahydrofolate dehydrogenase (NADP+)/methenyltetrahydrofolate cyclohydrolase|nr:bifunctional 5,10-methylenetetrahydrofolate dehydrogenase/5,10-methenyltetrahydrofolate cyclohydrolase [Oscillospiraceae bacterium]